MRGHSNVNERLIAVGSSDIFLLSFAIPHSTFGISANSFPIPHSQFPISKRVFPAGGRPLDRGSNDAGPLAPLSTDNLTIGPIGGQSSLADQFQQALK